MDTANFFINLTKLSSWCEKIRVDEDIMLPVRQYGSNLDVQLLLDKVADMLLDTKLTLHVASAFRAIILDLIERCNRRCPKSQEFNWLWHQHFSYCLSRILPQTPRILPFVVKYLKSNPPFFYQLCENNKMDDEECCIIAETAFRLLRYSRETFVHFYDWSKFLQLIDHPCSDLRWLIAQCYAITTKLNNGACRKFVSSLVPSEIDDRLTLRFLYCVPFEKELSMIDIVLEKERDSENSVENFLEIPSSSLVDTVVNVCGVLLPICSAKSNEEIFQTNRTVLVDTTSRVLQILALAISSGSSILLEGYVGSGKTMIIEYLAKVTGRIGPPNFIKVQMSDQMDSKSLLGAYCCTNVPGEFVWRPGALTRAVQEGYWLLLEDIDCAPMDVISILLPLLETGRLTILEQNAVIRVHPDFRLFATYRLPLDEKEGYTPNMYSEFTLLCLYLTRVHLPSLTDIELMKVATIRFPNITTILKKILEVYEILREEKRNLSGSYFCGSTRLLSTRDFMKCCNRIASAIQSYSWSGIEAVEIFQEVYDCFCSAVAARDERLLILHTIGGKFGLSKDKVEYIFRKYKPQIQSNSDSITIGNTIIGKVRSKRNLLSWNDVNIKRFSFTRQACILLERITKCIKLQEPVLLVGETGTGKTSTIQFLARELGHKLTVINMSQQSDTVDLLGGFKPAELRYVITPFRQKFETLFCQTFSKKQNIKFLGHIQESFRRQEWNAILKLCEHAIVSAITKLDTSHKDTLRSNWVELKSEIDTLKKQIKFVESALLFSFKEGALTEALKNGEWILLDEINLASSETLECLNSILESKFGSIALTEKGDIMPVLRQEGFHLFACMNPANDIGKKDIPTGIRNRFTEVFVDELLHENDLKILVTDYMEGLALSGLQIDGIIKFYLQARKLSEVSLSDGTGRRPNFTLRTLCRALNLASTNPCGTSIRSLYECFCVSFLTQLDAPSHDIVESLIRSCIVNTNSTTSIKNSVLQIPLPQPHASKNVPIEGYWIDAGEKIKKIDENYIMTPTVKQHLKDLARIVSLSYFPILLQGETSVGKTSLVHWLAEATGNHCVRINNHEHTDLQEYIGCYTANENGKLYFKEGILPMAMRKGYWIILDELNLAPSDVLEALNRVLDDNRELFITETQEVVPAHHRFRIFATQNPAGHYGGRKILSRAFRNRFIELHYDEIPSKELITILCERCKLPESYGQKLVKVMHNLQTLRCQSNVFAGKRGFITLRDLFRWAERYRNAERSDEKKFYDWDQHLADEGYMLLAGRVRCESEEQVIIDVIKKHFKREINPELLYGSNNERMLTTSTHWSDTTRTSLNAIMSLQDGYTETPRVVLTHNFRRLAVLVSRALSFGEPVLLVGETGCGKTTVCQVFAELYRQELFTVNCHMHTDTADFIGNLRPLRQCDTTESADSKNSILFKWYDGPLVTAMQSGGMFLIDEISLADDSVLERLNSVLESDKRLLVLAEKGATNASLTDEVEQIIAHPKFKVVATMNPSGDYGKKELSPALRNRFTEIWCPVTSIRHDLMMIIENNLTLPTSSDEKRLIGQNILNFIDWFSKSKLINNFVFSIRDLLSWTNFINVCTAKYEMNSCLSYIHGACLVFIDGLGSGSGLTNNTASISNSRQSCFDFIINQIANTSIYNNIQIQVNKIVGSQPKNLIINSSPEMFSIEYFSISKGSKYSYDSFNYAIEAPTTIFNALRLLRGLQLNKPILLEGSPGVGKTSLVTALAKATLNEVVRINLSEQTDITDLFGCDLPVEGGNSGEFRWRDGPFLSALKAGKWILLDELNLASQPVLEGLNACFDHRGEVFIPELGLTFNVQPNTRIFACQNPLGQGGGRKGLPKSFINRFTQVYIDPLTEQDYLFICKSTYPTLDTDLLQKMITFNSLIYKEVTIERKWGLTGNLWEFNLRDLFRWCELLYRYQEIGEVNPGRFVELIYASRMRTDGDREMIYRLYNECFCDQDNHLDPKLQLYKSCHQFWLSSDFVQLGYTCLPRRLISGNNIENREYYILQNILQPLEAVATCMEMQWMPIIIGNSRCGKSSLVRILSELTGNILKVLPVNSSMDTTELLGGFEQVSITRHIKQLIESIDNLVFLCSNRFTSEQFNRDSDISKLFYKWLSFKNIYDSNLGFENSFWQIVDYLDDIIDNITKSFEVFSFNDDLQNIPREILKVKKMYQQHANKLGGQFEWIESIVVEAMKNGYWLLIDNASFCNASVLDRLNPLLEPNGSLVITERGMLDGSLENVRPHPNFRIIMCVDPKHGDLSRAMRNRGIEIFLNDSFSVQDIHTLCRATGLRDTAMLDLIAKQMVSLDDGTVNFRQTMLSESQLASKYYSHGLICKNNPRLNSPGQPNAKIKEGKIIGITDIESINRLDDSNAIFIPSVAELTTHPIYGYVLWQGYLLQSLLVNTDESSLTRDKQNAIKIFIEKSSMADWKLRRNWICYLKGYFNDSAILHYLNYAEKLLIDVFEHPYTRCLYDEIPAFLPFILSEKHLPNGFFSNIGISKEATTQIVAQCSSSSINKKAILLQFIQNHAQELCDFRRCWNVHKTNNSLLSSSKLAKEGKISIIDLPHPVIAHIEPLFRNFDKCFLNTICNESWTISDNAAEELLDCLNWRARLYQECNLPLEKFKIQTLSLLWKWFKSKCLNKLSFTYNATIEGELQVVVEKLNSYLDYSTTKLFKTAGLKIFHKPMAYKSQKHLELNMKIVHIDRSLKIYRYDIPVDSLKMMRLLALQFNLRSDYYFRQLILNIAASVMFVKKENISDCLVDDLNILSAINKVEETLQNDKIGNSLQSFGTTIDESNELEMNLIDLSSTINYFGPVFEKSIITHRQLLQNTLIAWLYDINRQDVNWHGIFKELRQHVEFGLRYTMQSPKYFSPFRRIMNEFECEDKIDLLEVTTQQLLFDTMNSYWDFSGSEGVFRWQSLLSLTENDIKNDLGGPCELFYGNIITDSMFGLISQETAISNKYYNLAQIGQLKEKIKQLNTIASFLWCNFSQICHSYNNIWSTNYNTICFMTSRVLLAYRTIFATEMPRLDDLCNSFITDCLSIRKVQDIKFLEMLSAAIADTEIENSSDMAYRSSLQLVKNLVLGLLEDLRLAMESYLSDDREIKSDRCMLFYLGSAWVKLGLLLSIFAAPTDPVDPLIKRATKLNFLKEELEETKSEIKVRLQAYNLLAGFPYTSDNEPSCTEIPYYVSPHEENVIKRRCSLQESIKKLENKTAFRPSSPQYDKLILDINNIRQSLTLPANIVQLLQSLNVENCKGIPSERDETSLAKEIAWQRSMLGVINNIQANYPAYVDIHMPFSIALSFMRFGMRLSASPTMNIHQVSQFFKSDNQDNSNFWDLKLTSDSIIRTLIVYPADDNARTITYLLDSNVNSVFKSIVGTSTPRKSNELKAQLSNILLLLAYSTVIEQSYCIADVDFGPVLSIFECYYVMWKDHQMKKELKEDQQRSMFKYKIQEHITEDEEIHDNEEIRLLFPTYNNEFEETQDSTMTKESTLSKFDFQDVDIQELTSLHGVVFGILSTLEKISDHNILKYSDKVYKTLFQRKYVLASSIKKLLKFAVNADLDSSCIRSHILMSKFLLDEVTDTDVDLADKDTIFLPGYRDYIYDFYQDPNIGEAQELPAVMKSLMCRLDEILIEWPDHPVLHELQTSIRRVLSFSSSSPLMKYLTGLEFILKKAQDWESYASKAVSIRCHLDEVTKLIIRWRSIELKSWSKLLDLVHHNFKSSANRWWFHIYELYIQFIKSDNESNKLSCSEIVKTLSQFVENSNLGEFTARLDLLRSFYCQLTYEKHSAFRNSTNIFSTNIEHLQSILGNIYQYYFQFLRLVEDKVKSMRSPIDKELQDFVKISKWNDYNYWSLKEGISRTHRTLHKYIKRFRQCLSEPVGPLLVFTSQSFHVSPPLEISIFSSGAEFQPSTDGDLKENERKVDLATFFESTLVQNVFTNDAATAQTNVLSRISSMTSKFRAISDTVTGTRNYSSLVLKLNGFCEVIIETIKELQDDTARLDTKKLADVKLLGLRKRRSLAMLFLSLKSIGMSYRKGLRYDKDGIQEKIFLCKPIDEYTIKHWNTISSKEAAAAFTTIWNKCESYFYKSCSHYFALITALNSPSEDLTYNDVERCHGFGSEILRKIIVQKGKVSLLADELYELNVIRERIARIKPRHKITEGIEPSDLPPQTQSITWINRIKRLTRNTLKGLLEMRLLLECCPTTRLEPLPTPWQINYLPNVSKAIAGDVQVIAFIQKINIARNDLISVAVSTNSGRIDDHSYNDYVSWLQIDSVARLCEKLQIASEIISDLEEAFKAEQDWIYQPSKCIEPFIQLKLDIAQTCHEFYTWQINISAETALINSDLMQNYLREVNAAITHTLYVAQILLQSTDIQGIGEQVKSKAASEDEDDGEFEKMQPELLSATESNVLDILDKLRIPKIIKSYNSSIRLLSQLHDEFYDAPGQKLLICCCNVMMTIKPLIFNYVLLVEFYFHQYLLLHRTSCKLSHILMNTFVELMAKGFCQPQESDSKVGGDSLTEFVDQESGGVGEGEGSKDVSDMIENEDQLLDARQDGESQQSKNDEQKDLKAEDNAIEMSEDFDGHMQDAARQENDDSENESESDVDENELDKQMGEVDDNDNEEILDEKLWGSDSDDEGEEIKESDQYGGSGAQEDVEIVAKENREANDGKSGEELDNAADNEDDESGSENNSGSPPSPNADENEKADHDQDHIRDDVKDSSEFEIPDELSLDDDIRSSNSDKMEDDLGESGTENESSNGSGDDDEDIMDKTATDDDNGKDYEQLSDMLPEESQINDDETQESNSRMNTTNVFCADNQYSTEERSVNAAQNIENNTPNTNDDTADINDGLASGNAKYGHSGQSNFVEHVEDEIKTEKRPFNELRESNLQRKLAQDNEMPFKRRKAVNSSAVESEKPVDNEGRNSNYFQHLRPDEESSSKDTAIDAATSEQLTQNQDNYDQANFEEDLAENQNLVEAMDTEVQDTTSKVQNVDAKSQRGELKDLPKTEQQQSEQENSSGNPMEEIEICNKAQNSYHMTSLSRLQDSTEAALRMDFETFEDIRHQLEQQLQGLFLPTGDSEAEDDISAQQMWQHYCQLTAPLSRELCEQLRLVLEPTLANKLKGDYRTGKRLNIRKVIPYIASNYRKDKIWLRRSKKSKRQYQIVLAIDDSSSMNDNHSKQLAFESLSVISNALVWLEAGELAIMNFGEEVKLLHPFHQPFNDEIGGKIIKQFSFSQKKTRISQLLQSSAAILTSGKTTKRYMTATNQVDINQLLIIISDGRGLFVEGTEIVLKSVRAAIEAGTFIVFVILDNPKTKDSIIDIRMPVFNALGQIERFKTYMDEFPFPYYIVLRDINSLPQVLASALRQWFEMINSSN